MAEQSFDIFARIRACCADVAERAIHVRIHLDRIGPYALTLPLADGGLPPLDTERHFIGDDEQTTAYFLTLAAVNFGSGYFPRFRKRPGMTGYFTVASSVAERFRTSGPFPAETLAGISPQACAHLFGQHLASPPMHELMTLFSRAWNNLGVHLIERFHGRFTELIEAAGHSSARLIDLLSTQPFFRDEADYRGEKIPFYKRAQLLASDLALALNGRNSGQFDDLDRLTIFADNLVPHVLRVDGLISYSEPLAATIERGEEIPSGSTEEVELRACAVHTAELVREALLQNGTAVTARQLDQILWHRGQQPEIKAAGKRHRTRTVYY